MKGPPVSSLLTYLVQATKRDEMCLGGAAAISETEFHALGPGWCLCELVVPHSWVTAKASRISAFGFLGLGSLRGLWANDFGICSLC